MVGRDAVGGRGGRGAALWRLDRRGGRRENSLATRDRDVERGRGNLSSVSNLAKFPVDEQKATSGFGRSEVEDGATVLSLGLVFFLAGGRRHCFVDEIACSFVGEDDDCRR